MILHEITLRNVGIYGAEKVFRFTPRSDGRFNRPITLLRGKNGVGKSTLMEAVRHGLHGSLVLGGRATQAEYESYLRNRIYHPRFGEPPKTASIDLQFDMVFNVTRRRYRIVRQWDISRKAVAVDLRVYEDDLLIRDVDGDTFLRDLIDPGLLDLFFFDGERIRTLAAAGEQGEAMLGDSIRQLLGLHLVEQLNRDLGVYMTRKDVMHELSELTEQLGAVEANITMIEMHIEQAAAETDDLQKQLRGAKGRLRRAEQKLVREGSDYADRRRTLELQEQECLMTIAATEARIHELCRGVLPFATVPDLLREVREQLLREEAYERWSMAHTALGEVRQALLNDGLDADQLARHFAPYETPPLAEADLIHRVSAESRRQMLSWIDEALNVAPLQVLSVISELEQHKTALSQIRDQISHVPDEQQLKPLRDDVEKLKPPVWEIERKQVYASERLLMLIEQRRQLIAEQHVLNDQIARSEADSTPLKLAARTRQLLRAYEERLTATKLGQVEERLTARFVQLCRKRNFVDHVAINPETFAVTLYHGTRAFSRSQLSAGEKQLFAIATLWALREVSNRPMPVLIDTPLSRLDSEHRQAMLTEFFPHVAHQTIILATDAEVNDAFLDDLKPALSHFYQLTFDEAAGETEANYRDLDHDRAAYIGIEEIVVQ